MRTSSYSDPDSAEFSSAELVLGSDDEFADAPTLEPDPLIGRVLAGRYRVDELIAAGGMGSVYRGLHVTMRKRVAIKLLHPRLENFPHLVTRFEREAIAGAHVQHPNVASATDFAELEDGSRFLVLEYVEGVTLARVLEDGPLTAARAAHIARQVALALGAVHAMGILHRDVKPRNIMLVKGQTDVVKLIDFGIARVPIDDIAPSNGPPTKAKLTAQGAMLGSPPYMAPETALGMDSVDERADLYSLGIVLYKMLTGLHPFDADCDVDYILHSRSTPAPRMRDRAPHVAVPAELEAVALRLLEKDPRARFATAKAIVDAIDAAIPTIEHDSEPIGWNSALPTWIVGAAKGEERLGDETGDGTTTGRITDDETTVPRADEHVPSAPGVPAAALDSLSPTVGPRRPATNPPPGRSADRANARKAAPSRAAAPGRSVRWALAALWAVSCATTAAIVWRAHRAHPQIVHAPPLVASRATPPSIPSLAPAAIAAPPPEAPPSAATSPLSEAEAEALRNRVVAAAAVRKPDVGADALVALAQGDAASFARADVQRAAAAIATALEQAKLPARDRIFPLLSDDLGGDGLDVLYDIESGRGGTGAAARAAQLLRRPKTLERTSPALRIAIELRDASCADKPALFDRGAADGDDRALAVLELMRTPQCRLGTGQCCFGASAPLDRAIEALRAKRHGAARAP